MLPINRRTQNTATRLIRAALAASVIYTISPTSTAQSTSQTVRETGLLTGASTPLQSGLDAVSRGDYETARENLEKAATHQTSSSTIQQKAHIALGWLSILEGKYDDAIRLATKAERAGGDGSTEAAAILAQAYAKQGKIEKAIAAVRKVEREPEARLARVILGELLLRTGDSAGARAVLMTLVRDYNNDIITDRDGDDLALVGRAAHLLRSASDANSAYNKAEQAGAKSTQLLLWRAELFLDKYDAGHAEEVLNEALKRDPRHPDALVLMSRVKAEHAYDFSSAEALIATALAVNPKHTGAFYVRAGLALREYALDMADAAINEGLLVNPNDLELLSLRAATRFLADDTSGFDASRSEVMKRNPQFSDMYQIIGEYAEWEHRYTEIVAMMQEAVKVRNNDGKAWAVLGLNLIRTGDDVSGIDALRKSWSLDKFNVRVYNTLNLFEKEIPSKYTSLKHGNFLFRYDKSESEMLERYVPPLLEEAFASMTKRYGFTPTTPIGIELYSDMEHFSVRTSGLPRVGVQGVCFGRTLAAPSPFALSYNYANVLWHELAHVFALQLSNSHVPRWFTEGLSEYETIIRYPQWQREEDMPLYLALKSKRLPSIANFNRAFTHAENPEDIGTAYYAASQIVAYIAEQHGFEKITSMLRLWGQGLRDTEVIKQVLGLDASELDKRFVEWVEPRLSRYRSQFVPDMRAPSTEEARNSARTNPTNIKAQTDLVLALLRDGETKDAKEKTARLAGAYPQEPLINYLQSRFLIGAKDYKVARQTLEQIIKNGNDGYSVRMELAAIAESNKDKKTMRAHLEAARRFDPMQSEPLRTLHDLAKSEKRDADVLSALRELSVLDQHEPRVVSQLLRKQVEAGSWQEAIKTGPIAIHSNLRSAQVHRDYALALFKVGRNAPAISELESAVLCNPDKKELAQVFELASEVYEAMGRHDDAEKAKAKAREHDKK